MKNNNFFLKLLIIILSISLVASSAPLITRAEENTPEIISIKTADDLIEMSINLVAGGHYTLENDIELVYEWVPIDGFRGTFDGQRHSINNLYILSSSNVQYAGLFGLAGDGMAIKNVGVNIASEGLTASGGVASAGGLISFSNGGTVIIENCYVTGDVTAFGTAYAYAGGLIGYNTGGASIVNSYAVGDITANILGTGFATHAYAGGLIGFCYGGVFITNCYVACDVTANAMWFASAGGLIGRSNDVGGLFITNCYRLDTEIIGYNQDSACIQLNVDEMRLQSSFESWDFDTIWAITPKVNNGFPYLCLRDKTFVSATPSAFVTKLNGNMNDLTITVAELFSDGSTNDITQTFSINNNSAGTYQVDNYNIYVDTKGNTQIRACYII
jgi:hypothetical protein